MRTDPHHPSGWRWALLFALALALVRLAIVMSAGLPLAADEAHYWDWSRHLDWSYPTKGPGIAYAIAAATSVLGDQPWAVRTVAIVSASLGVLLAFGLARSAASELDPPVRARAGKWGALLVALLPPFQVTGLLATIDAPYIACWIGASWAGLATLRALESKRSAMTPALLFGVALGIGFLFKYTILFLAPSLLIALLVRRKRLYCWKRTVGTLVALGGVFALCAMPVILWNQREGWPTVAHLLGHLGAPGGDVPIRADGARAGEVRVWTILWFIEFVGSQIGIVGPALALMYLAVRRGSAGLVRTWCLAAAGPILIVYLLVSLVTDAEANWPIAGYATLLAFAALSVPTKLDAWRERVRAWEALPEEQRPRAGYFRKRPETPWQLWTHWTVGYGVGLAVLTVALPIVAHTPAREGPLFQRVQRTERLTEVVMRALDEAGTGDVAVVASRYTYASRLAHALHLALGDDAPRVTSGASLMGDRKSAYDYWPETDPRRLRAGTLVFVGGERAAKWTRRYEVASITPMLDEPDPDFGNVFVARGVAGLKEVGE